MHSVALSRCIPSIIMAKDGQVCFHRGPFADLVKQQRCTTEPVRPLDGINKDVCGAKLHPTAVLAHPVDYDCWCHLLDTNCCCMRPIGTLNPSSASHPLLTSLPPPSPYTCHSWYYSLCDKSHSKSSSVS